MQPLSPVTELQPATDSSDFSEMVLEVLRQLAKVPSSFVSLLQERQMQGLAALCSRVDVQDREVVYHDGDDSGFLGIILCGKFNLTMHGHVLLDLQVGDIVGELELCNPRGGSSCRQHTLIADGRSVVARITFDGFEAFIESMGPRHAKRLSRLLAEYALTKVVKEEEDAVQQDRNRLETIGSTRRMAFSNACRTDLFWNVDVDDPGESNVPFYFQKETERWPNMEKAIDAVMSRVPMLMCLDVDMKNKVKSTFLVATKKIGQFIAHKGQRLDYFFIIYRGECGNYAQLTAAGSRPPSALSHHVLPSSPLHTTDRFSVHKSPPRSESLVMTRTDSNATAATSVSKTSDVVQSQHRQIQSPPEQLRQLAQSPSVGPRRFPLSSVGAHEASVRGTTRSIGTPTLGPTSSALATHTPPIDDANFSRTSSGGTVSDVAYSIAASKKASGKLARNKSKVQYELLSTIEEGRWFGEMGLIVESKSDMNIKALSEVVLLMLPTKAFRDLRDGYEKKMFHLRSRLVKGAPFGKFLDRERTCKVADALVQRHYQAGDSVINAESTDFFILQSGVAVEMKQDTARDSSPGRASPLPTLPRSSSPVTRAKPGQRFLTDKDPNTIREHHDGSCFCEWNLNVQNIDSRSWEISAVPLNPLVFAKTDCIFLVLDRKTFIDVIGSYDALINGKDAAEDLERHEVEKSVQNKRKFKTAGFPSSAALGNANASSSRRLSQGSFGSSRRSSLNESTAPSGSVSSSLPLPPNGQKNEATVSLNENSREEGKGNHSASSEIVGMDGMDVILPLPVPCKSEFNDSTNDGHSNLLEHEETSLMVRDDGSLHMIREQSEDFNWTPLPKKSSPLPQAVRSPLSGTGNTMATPIAITEKDATSSLEVFKEVDVPHSLWLKKETKGIDVGDTEVNFDLEIDSELDPEIRAIAEEMVRTMFLEASAEASDLPLSEALNCLAGDKTELEKSGHGQRHAERPQDLEEEIAVETNLFTLIEGPQSPHSGSSGSEQISTFNSPRTQNSTIYRHVATPVSSALADVAGRLNEHITLDDSLPMHRNSSRPNTSERKDFMSNSGSEEGRESGNPHQIRPSTSSKAPESSIPYSPALSKVGNSSSPNTPILGVSGRWNRPGSTGSYSIWPGAGTAGEPHTNRRETPDSRFGIDPPTLSR
jgi:CRP-like cAMP-binding protein